MQHLEASSQLRAAPLAGRTSNQRPFTSARRGKRANASRPRKTVTRAEGGLFGGLGKAVQSGTVVLRLPGQQDSKEEQGGTKRLQLRRGGGRVAGPDPGLVFVAGSTGRLGARIVRELLKQGYRVRAGVRNMDKAENFVRTAANYGLLSAEELGRLDVVAINLEQPDTIPEAIGNAGRVVCAVGAAESEVSDFSAPQRIDGEGTIALVEAATKAGVQQFVMVTSLGTGKIGFPAAILNVFGGVLIWKRKAEEALERSGMNYAIVRPGGMERPRDDYKLTHNVRLATRDSLFGGQVSRLQVAELVAACVGNDDVAANKVLEVVAETNAPLLSWEDLLLSVPSEESQEQRAQRRQREIELLGELEAAREQLSAAEKRLEAVRGQLAAAGASAAELKKQEAAVRKEQEAVLKQAQAAEAQLAKLTSDAELKARQAAASKAVLAAAQQAQREGRLLEASEIAEIRANIINPPKPKEEAAPKAGGFALPFGKKEAPKPAAKEEPKAEEKKAPSKAPPKAPTLLSFLSPKAGVVEVVDEQVVVVEEEVVVEEAAKTAAAKPAAKKAAGGGLFAGLLGKVAEAEAKQIEQEKTRKQALEQRAAMAEASATEAATTREAQQKARAEAKAAAERAAREAAERAAAEAAKAEAEETAREMKERAEAAAKAEAAKAAEEKARAEAAAQAAQAQKEREEQERAAEAAEAAALERIQAEKEAEEKKKREEAEKARKEAETAARAEAEKKEAAARAEAEKKAAAEAEAKAVAEDVARRQAEVKDWIAQWRKRQAAGGSAAAADAPAAAEQAAADANPFSGLLRMFGVAPAEPEAPAAPAAAAAAGASPEEDAAKRKTEAAAWIASWREKQAAAPKAAAPAPPAAAPAPKADGDADRKAVEADAAKRKAEAAAWISAWREKQAAPAPAAAAGGNGTAPESGDAANPFTGLLRMFGAAPAADKPAESEAPAAPAAAAAGGLSPEEDAAQRKAEAAAWIAAFRARQAASNGAGPSNPPAAAAAGELSPEEDAARRKEEVQAWVAAWRARK